MVNKIGKSGAFRGDTLVAFSLLIFGTYALFIKLLPGIPVVLFLFSMQAVGMVTFFFLAWRAGFQKTDAKAKWLLIALAVIATANDLTYFWAFRLTSVANASVAHQLVSVFLIFFSPLFLGERTKKNEWISLVIGFVVIFILFEGKFSLSSGDTVGILLGIASALFYALLILIYRYMPGKGYTVDFMNFWRFTLSTALLLPAIPYFGGFRLLYENFWSLAAFGILFGVIAARINLIGISRTRPIYVSIIGKSEPVIAMFYAFIFLGQIPTAAAILGGTLIIGASLWLALKGGEAE